MRKQRPAVDLDAILTEGGAARVALFQHCVKSVTVEPMFLFLAREYALRPTRDGALALYDVFCATNAVARVNASHALPPRVLRLSASVAQLRQASTGLGSADPEVASMARRVTAPRNLFDGVVAALRDDRKGPVAALARRYDPTLTPVENLPGGRMTAGQRQFVDGVWRPLARPRLVAAGFWQVGTID